MAWLFKRGSIWWIGWRVNGRQFLKSTKQRDEKIAEKRLKDCVAIEATADAGRLTDAFIDAFSESRIVPLSYHAALKLWLDESRSTVADGTWLYYVSKMKQFTEFLKATEDGPLLNEITPDDVIRFINEKKTSVRTKTANDTIVTLKCFFNRCVEMGRLRKNPAEKIKFLKAPRTEKRSRRALTLEEVGKIYKACPNDFWRYMVLGGFYTGLRLGDLASLAWENVDLKIGLLRVETLKTGRTVHIPIATPFKSVLLGVNEKKAGFIWPEQADLYKRKPNRLSKEFSKTVLVPAGMINLKEYNRPKNGEARRTDCISFHYLRHTFVSYLKISGASQSVAKELAGHSNDEISDLYTTVPVEVLEKAVNQLPIL